MAEVKDYSVEGKFNDSANTANKYLVSGLPTTEYSFEIGVSINKRGCFLVKSFSVKGNGIRKSIKVSGNFFNYSLYFSVETVSGTIVYEYFYR